MRAREMRGVLGVLGGVRVVFLALFVGLWCWVVGVGVAGAVTVHSFSGSFGGAATSPVDPYPLGSPGSVAVDGSSGASKGAVYVTDPAHFRVEKFTASGEFLLMFGSDVNETTGGDVCTAVSKDVCKDGVEGAGGEGQFMNPAFVAVDSSEDGASGDVYVADTGTSSVYQFTSEGAYISVNTGASALQGPFVEIAGLAVDAAGHLWVTQVFNSATFEFESAGLPIQEWGDPFGTKPVGMSVDSVENVYVVNAFHAVEKLTASGEKIGEITDHESVPTGLALDLGSNDLYVDLGSSIEHYSPSCNPSGGVCQSVEAFGGGVLSSGEGLAASGDVVYAADVTAGVVDRFDVGLEVETGPAGVVGADAAEVSGGANPEGSLVESCVFEYGLTTEYGHSVPCTETAGGGSSTVEVHAQLIGLESGSVYHYRLVAKNSSGTARGEDQQLETLPEASVESVAVENLTASSVDLSAEINPKGLEASYQIELGTDTSYGRDIPATFEGIGSGTANVHVTQHVDGLIANVEYHWRVVTEDANGRFESPDHTFIYEQLASVLPDGRKYEMVTPPDKSGALIGALLTNAIPTQVAGSGTRVVASSEQCFEKAESCIASRDAEGEPYEFTRTTTGWVTRPMAPPATEFEVNSTRSFSADEDTALFEMPTTPGAPSEQDSFYARRSNGEFVRIGPVREPGELASQAALGTLVATGSLSHLVYASKPPAWPSIDSSGSNASAIYEYTGAGNSAPRLVAVSGGASSADLIGVCGSHIGDPFSGLQFNAQSESGDVLYFAVEACPSGSGANSGKETPAEALYARVGGDKTIPISVSTDATCHSVACQGSAPEAAVFQGASANGDNAFFLSGQQLTDSAHQDTHAGDSARENKCALTAASAAGCNLYESICPEECASPVNRELVDVSAGDETSENPRVQGVLGISSDGSHIYFVSKSILTHKPSASDDLPIDGSPNVYVYERDAAAPNGRLTFIATLSPADEKEWLEGIGYANVTPNGDFLLFTSHLGLTSDATRHEGPQQVYRYDDSNGELVRISIGRNGFGDNGNAGEGEATITSALRNIDLIGIKRPSPSMSNDGRYVFFESPSGLAPHALNDVKAGRSLAENVYEYHDGLVSLITGGKDTAEGAKVLTTEVELLGTDATGENVFFATAEALVAKDTDTARDYYDAHVCTVGTPCPPEATAPQGPCTEEECHVMAPQAPATEQMASSGRLVSTGNVPITTGGTVTASPGKLLVLAHKVTGPRFRLSIRITQPGAVGITSPSIRYAKTTKFSKAGNRAIEFQLTRVALKQLRERHRITITLRVKYAQRGSGEINYSRVRLTVELH